MNYLQKLDLTAKALNMMIEHNRGADRIPFGRSFYLQGKPIVPVFKVIYNDFINFTFKTHIPVQAAPGLSVGKRMYTEKQFYKVEFQKFIKNIIGEYEGLIQRRPWVIKDPRNAWTENEIDY
jgi:hypothetical protein